MQGKYWVVAGLILLFTTVAGGVFLFLGQSHKQKVISPEASLPSISPTPTVAVLATWTDPAGFTFQYPNDLTINKHEEDNDSYAHVELSSPNHPGGIIVWAVDAKNGVSDADSWVKQEKSFAHANVLDTTLGGVTAKKILIPAPEKKLIVGTVRDSIVFFIDGTLIDSDYWSKVHDTITSSFAFNGEDAPKQAQTSQSNTTGDGGDEAADETETLE